MIEVEGTIFAIKFSKKYDLSLLSIEGWVLDRFRAFDRLTSVDAHLCLWYVPYLPEETPITLTPDFLMSSRQPLGVQEMNPAFKSPVAKRPSLTVHSPSTS